MWNVDADAHFISQNNPLKLFDAGTYTFCFRAIDGNDTFVTVTID